MRFSPDATPATREKSPAPAPAQPAATPTKLNLPAKPASATPEKPAAEPTLATNLAAAAVSLSAAAQQAASTEKAPASKTAPAKPADKVAPQKPTEPAPKAQPLRQPDSADPKRKSSLVSWLVSILILAAVVLAGVLIYTHFFASKSGSTTAAGGKAGHGKGARDQARVVTAVAKTEDIPVYITGLGAVTPTNTVTVQSRVNGQLMQVLFTEGQMVHTGDHLLVIDPRPYQAMLEQQQAQQEHDQALLDNANIDLQRYQTLWQQDSIPKQTLDTQASLVNQDKATVDADKALVDQTKLNIVYCNIDSPIDGRVGLRLVDVGNYIQVGSASSSSAGLVVITQIQPITVIYTIPEDSIPAVSAAMRADPQLPVDAYVRGGFTQKLATGSLLTIDNQIDPTTGTVKLRASYPNQDNALFPNQFVNTRMLVDTKKSVITVPIAAVQYGTGNQTFVYILDTDAKTVKLTNVTVGVKSFDGLTIQITKGVNDGDTVITDGVDKLTDGAKVTVAQPDDASSSAASSDAGSGAPDSAGDNTAEGQTGQTSGEPTHHHHKKKPQSGDTNAAPAS